ncbi:hypothetical protein ACFL1B_05065 [Nanoarchaeota archaeon]
MGRGFIFSLIGLVIGGGIGVIILMQNGFEGNFPFVNSYIRFCVGFGFSAAYGCTYIFVGLSAFIFAIIGYLMGRKRY